ncbi:hypothetical protein AB0C21_13820 [Spirillospora sp. NPDC049024]
MGRRKRAQSWDGRSASGRRVDRSGACRKKPFATYEEAEADMRRYRESGNARAGSRLPTQVQQCEQCDAYHITGALSKPAPAGKLRRRRKGGMGWK